MQVDGCRITIVCLLSPCVQILLLASSFVWNNPLLEVLSVLYYANTWYVQGDLLVLWVDLFVVWFSLCRSLPLPSGLKDSLPWEYFISYYFFIINNMCPIYWFLTTSCLYATTHGWICLLTPSCLLWTWYEPFNEPWTMTAFSLQTLRMIYKPWSNEYMMSARNTGWRSAYTKN